MVELNLLAAWVATQYLVIERRLRRDGTDRGDVPGWVMVTVMTAGLVVGIFAVFNHVAVHNLAVVQLHFVMAEQPLLGARDH